MKYLLDPLMPMPVYLAMFTAEKAYYAWARRLKITAVKSFVPSDANGSCHFYENDEGHTIVAVCLDLVKLAKKDTISVACIIVHEAVHVYQECLEYIGEKNPGAEFEAYAIQRISEQLMRSYVEQTG